MHLDSGQSCKARGTKSGIPSDQQTGPGCHETVLPWLPFRRFPMRPRRTRVRRTQAATTTSARRRPNLSAAINLPENQLCTTRVTRLTGDFPTFNDWSRLLEDHEGENIYLYGGCRPGDLTPTSDFYSCNMKTMKWTNHTVRSANCN